MGQLTACLRCWPSLRGVPARAALALLLLQSCGTGLAFAATPAAAPTDARCLACHDDPTLKDAAGHSLAVSAAVFAGSAHRHIACVDCHKDAEGVRHPREPLGPVALDVCAGCHQADIEQLKASVHAWKAVSVRTCAGCHGDPHAVLASGNPNNSMSAVNQVRNCGHCHQDMMEGYLSSEHARALFVAGLVSAPACTDCHGSGHGIQSASVAGAAVSHAQIPETCGRCHAGILGEWRDSAHGVLWLHGGQNGPVCTTCHQAHAIKPPQSAAMRQIFPGDCGNCHAAYYESFRDTLHGQAGVLGETAAAICSDCHTAHQNLAAADPRSSINPAHLASTCGRCHDGAVNAAFLTFDPHANPRDPERNPYLHWVWLLMTLLLLGVFGFFGLHDLLWLQRTLVGSLRGEYRQTRPASGRYVRRFTTSQIALHVTVVVSFLVLAATGLPLKYAASPWAPRLMALLGGPHSAGILHRVAAVVTFGYFAFHLLGALYQMIVRHERGFLWGPRSMMPQPRDVRDLIANVGYFLYLRPRPPFDRWTYWEKFDYLAVFWGVAIIGLTGLMLWFPGAFTRFLPGWTLNAAYIAHSDEALLATGFIFIFHYFHTHLRPETFPMDTAVFTGRISLERFQEERPLEYQRLAAANRLDSVLAPAPTRTELLRAYVFGVAAVAIGVALAVGIFVALLGNLSR
jgi:cytochrome b subunit of formate dehydrogenase